MKNKWLNIILIICMIILQRVVIQMSGYEVYQLPFASTLFIFRVMQEKLQPDMVSFG